MEINDVILIARQLWASDLFYLTPRLVAGLFDLEMDQAYTLLDRLERHHLVISVEKGKYLLLGLEPEKVLSNPLFIATRLVNPSYVSYWSALHYYGLTEQVPHTIFIATTRKKRPVTFQTHRFRYVTLKPAKFFGYHREAIEDLPVLLADEEKALIDSLDQPRYAGGMAEVARALALAASDLDVDLLLDYARRMADRSLALRLGYLLEQQGITVDGLPISASPVLLDPSAPPEGVVNTRWRVRVNLPEEEMQMEGVG